MTDMRDLTVQKYDYHQPAIDNSFRHSACASWSFASVVTCQPLWRMNAEYVLAQYASGKIL